MRKTKIRTDLLSLLDEYQKPAPASQLLHFLAKKHPSINKTTVYRELAFLKAEKIVRDVSFNDGIMRFEKNDPKCHHHLICETCGEVEDVSINEEKLLENIQGKSKFEIKRHSIEFFGVCKNCK